ncbi:MAG: glycosyltransferase family 39 protein [Fibromonadales bacterium]|nr:glycosyltransferase family 39 protein [Fibromonadales bacterium]
MKIRKILSKPLIYLLPLLALAWFWIIPTESSISDVVLTIDGTSSSESFPISTYKIKNDTEFLISFNINVKENKKAVYKFHPDDCIISIEINGNAFPQEMIKEPCDYSRGTRIDFSKYAQIGLNKIEVKMKNSYGGPGGLRIDYPYEGFSSIGFKHILFSILLLIIAAIILRKFKFGISATLLVLLGIGIRLIYFSYTSPTERVYDMEYGHFVYMNMIIEDKQIPQTDACWSCNHPPLYYLMGAGIISIFNKMDPFYSLRFLQQIAMLFSFVSLAFGVALLYRLFGDKKISIFSSLLFVVWPGFVITAPRIGNDVPYYLGALMCMLFAQMWWNKHKSRYLLLSFLGAGIAVLFKSPGFVILGALALIFICGVFRFWELPRLKIILGIFLIVLVSAFGSQYRIISDFFRDKAPSLAVVNVNPGLNVKTSLGSFFYFDAKDYFTEAYTSTWTDAGGRQYFWNFFIKSTLFGEYSVWNSKLGRFFASILNFINFIFFLLIFWGILNMKIRNLPSLLFFTSLIASLIFIRARYSVGCMQDFRYIAPILIPMLLFTFEGAQILQNVRLRLGIYFSMLIFVVLSFLFIVLPGF